MEVADGLPPRERWRAMLAVAIAVAMSVLVTSIANIALPTIAHDMDATPAASIWVVNAYQLAVTVTLLPFASMGDIYGHRRVYIWGLAVLHRGVAGLRAGAVAAGAGDRPRAARLRRRRHHERQRRAGALHLSRARRSAAGSASTRWWSPVRPPPGRRSPRRSCRCCPGPGCSRCRCRPASWRCGWRTASCRGRRAPAIRSIR